MAKTERADYVRVGLSPKNPFGLTFPAPGKNRNLFIEEPGSFGTGTTAAAQDLLRTVMMAHLIVRHFPKVIETNFEVGSKEFLDKLYKHYGFGKPKIVRGEDRVKPVFVNGLGDKKEKATCANAHSGGLDSIYRAARLITENEKILIAHLRNLNPKGNHSEAIASREQAGALNVPYEEIRLRNGTDNTGFAVMRTRDMFLALAVAMVAEPYGVKKIFIEGDMQTDPKAHFTEYAPAWIFFNKLIADVGLNSQVEGMDAHDIETVGEVLRLEERLGMDILSKVQNCFAASHQVGNNRRKWERETPTIAKSSSYHWCGSCTKCRRMTLGRLFYHDPKFKRVPRKEVQYFIDDTVSWLEKYPHNRDLISGSFLKHLEDLKNQHEI